MTTGMMFRITSCGCMTPIAPIPIPAFAVPYAAPPSKCAEAFIVFGKGRHRHDIQGGGGGGESKAKRYEGSSRPFHVPRRLRLCAAARTRQTRGTSYPAVPRARSPPRCTLNTMFSVACGHAPRGGFEDERNESKPLELLKSKESIGIRQQVTAKLCACTHGTAVALCSSAAGGDHHH